MEGISHHLQYKVGVVPGEVQSRGYLGLAPRMLGLALASNKERQMTSLGFLALAEHKNNSRN
jgi:hypothetical protein